MSKKHTNSIAKCFILGLVLMISSCSNTAKAPNEKETSASVYPSDITPFFDHWNLIFGNGSNAGQAINFEQKDFFYSANAGDTHGTSNNTRTELA